MRAKTVRHGGGGGAEPRWTRPVGAGARPPNTPCGPLAVLLAWLLSGCAGAASAVAPPARAAQKYCQWLTDEAGRARCLEELRGRLVEARAARPPTSAPERRAGSATGCTDVPGFSCAGVVDTACGAPGGDLELACCACGGGCRGGAGPSTAGWPASCPVDSGGDGCDYYQLHPSHCGCCDDDDFSASLLCPSSCSAGQNQSQGGNQSAGGSLGLAGWPSKTTRIAPTSRAFQLDLPLKDWPAHFPLLQRIVLSSVATLQTTIPPEFGNFTRLRELSLKDTGLSGTIPPELGQLRALEWLDLGLNRLEGTIPPELGQLGNLTNLHLNQLGPAYLTGTIPPQLGQLRSLRIMRLSGNQLNGTLPVELGQLRNLSELDLSDNMLMGSIHTDFGHLQSLQILQLASNQLYGTLPSELGQLAALQTLSAGFNALTGTLPTQLGQLGALRSLQLEGNELFGSIPPDLGRASTLEVLHLGSNRFSGTLPPQLGQLSHLRQLELDVNQLTGTLPTWLGQLTSLQHLNLAFNLLQGTIPRELGQLRSLTYLGLNSNGQLAGPIPAELGNLDLLTVLNVTDSRLNGTIPSELGRMASLQVLSLSFNQLTGSIPGSFGALSNLWTLQLAGNALSGTIPKELGNITQLQIYSPVDNTLASTAELRLQDNRLTGTVPPELGSLTKLQALHLGGNRLSGSLPANLCDNLREILVINVSANPSLGGTFPNTTLCYGSQLRASLDQQEWGLKEIYAQRCNFTSAGPVATTVQILNFAKNSLSMLPEAWENLASVRNLNISDNKITHWRPHGLVLQEEPCTFQLPRLHAPDLGKLDLSGNPLGVGTVLRDFLWSLAYLESLTDLRAARCRLKGSVPAYATMADQVDMTSKKCAHKAGFPWLRLIDLSDNQVEQILVPPAAFVSEATFSRNSLTKLHSAWFQNLLALDISVNPRMYLPVNPAPQEDACPAGGALTFTGDPGSWLALTGGKVQCAKLCIGTKTRYVHDYEINASSLCRCREGLQGRGMDCSGCPADTYSVLVQNMIRVCQPCPKQAATREGKENATSISDCLCAKGWYMVQTASNSSDGTGTMVASCQPCAQWPYRTTAGPGAVRADQCACDDANYKGLRALGEICGCVDGEYMDHVSRQCKRCGPAEDCSWGSDVARSLLPPVVNAANWAEPWANDTLDNFSGHDVWRCLSKDSCTLGGECADGRIGRACGVCAPGLYGPPDGECIPCQYDPRKTRQVYGLAFLASPLGVVPAHLLLTTGGSARGCMLALRSLRTSLKQVMKYVQTLGVVSFFSVHWPPLAKDVFMSIAKVSIGLPSLSGAACLTGEQTATSEMAFRWLTPAAGLTCVCATALVLRALRPLLRRYRHGELLEIGPWDVLRLCLWASILFYSTLLQYGVEILTCIPGPNGKFTVATFPHLECSEGSSEWPPLAGVAAAFITLYVAGVFAAVYTAWRTAIRAHILSGMQHRGWWGFLFEDFREGCTHWQLIIMGKDALLVTISVAGAGNGPTQLILSAAGTAWFAYIVLRDQPFAETTNSLLEAWGAVSLSVICLIGSGLGYGSSPGVADSSELFQEGMDDPKYRSRAWVMVAIQLLTFIPPALILTYQMITMPRWVRKWVPKCLRPEDEEARERWDEEFFESVGLKESEDTKPFRKLIKRFDQVDAAKFRSLMGSSAATIGTVKTSESGLRGMSRRRMHDVAEKHQGFMDKVMRSMSARASRVTSKKSLPEVDCQRKESSPPAADDSNSIVDEEHVEAI